MKVLVFAAVCAVVAVSTACSRGPDLRPVTLPDLSRLDPGVQKQIKDSYDLLQARNESTALAERYGHYGMMLQAAEFFDAAEPSYLDAQTLAPEDVRWPYYLASLYKSRGETDKAEAAYKRALQLQPNDLATLIWLGRLEIDKGKAADAEQLFGKAYCSGAEYGRGAGRTGTRRRREARLRVGGEIPRAGARHRS